LRLCDELITSSTLDKIHFDILANPGNDYVVYVTGNGRGNETKIDIILEEGSYKVSWFNPKTGRFLPAEYKLSGEREKSIQLSRFTEDIVLYITRIDDD